MGLSKNFLYLIVFIIFTNCGFKVLDKTILNKFEINEINSVGDKRINFLIKNNVSKLINSKNAEELIDLEINSSKTRIIKEKNKNNKITKYSVEIITNLQITFLNNNKTKNFTVTRDGYYDVTDNNNEDRESLRRLEEHLTNEISQRIVKNILNLANDN